MAFTRRAREARPTRPIFPQRFPLGVGTSALQVEGNCTNNSWSAWEKKHRKEQTVDHEGNRIIEEYAGSACNQWNEEQMKKDVLLIKQAGFGAYRFSVEWSKIEPEEDIFDSSALDHYEKLCQELVHNGIKPVITLHHYTEPLWFAQKDGFERKENITYYVRFCTKVFERLHPYVHLWLTFNSPAAYALNSYFRGTRPPGKKSMQLSMEVLYNMLCAHVDTYHALKKLDGGGSSKIGILHNIFHLDPWNPYNPLDKIACAMGNMITNTCIYKFFSTGIFHVWIPGKVYVISEEDILARHSLDFIGLNYYSHAYMRWFKPTPAPNEIATDNPQYTIYAEGLYRACAELTHNIIKPLKQKTGKDIPLYITENGIGTTDDAKRDIFLKRTLYALSESCKDFNVKGYIHWSLMDNYEWGTYRKKYGVYEVDFKTQERTLKKGSRHFIDVVRHHTSCNP